MRPISRVTILSSTLIGSVVGCGSAAEYQEENNNDSMETYDAAGAAGDYFGIIKDQRKCASPTCGGWFLTRLNYSSTRCADGTFAGSCYTPVLDWSAADLPGEDQLRMLRACEDGASAGGTYAIVRGRFARSNHTPDPSLGRFVISEAWLAEGDTVANGLFVRTTDNGIRCFAAPCPSITEEPLNGVHPTDIASIDWAPADLTEGQIAECVAEMAKPDGLVVAGARYTVTGTAGSAPGRTASAAFYRLTGEPR